MESSEVESQYPVFKRLLCGEDEYLHSSDCNSHFVCDEYHALLFPNVITKEADRALGLRPVAN